MGWGKDDALSNASLDAWAMSLEEDAGRLGLRLMRMSSGRDDLGKQIGLGCAQEKLEYSD